MTVRLRPHHLLCMLTFVGKGYTPSFTRNYIAIAARLSAGEDIVMVEGPDDICAPLLDEPEAHCRRESVIARDDAAAKAAGDLLGKTIASGVALTPDAAFLKRMRDAFAKGDIRNACAGCEWTSLCTQVAAGGFPDVLIVSETPPAGG